MSWVITGSEKLDVAGISNVSLLLHGEGNTIVDSSPTPKTLSVFGSVATSSTEKKYGDKSISFNGQASNYIALDGSSAFAFGAGDFTIEMWVYFSSISGTRYLFDFRAAGASTTANRPLLALVSSSLNYYTADQNPAITGATLSASTWYHVALCRSAGATRLFIDGTQAGSTYADSQNYGVGTSRPVIGADGNSPAVGNLSGYIDELRITKGVARYQAAFTPRNAPFPDA